MTRTICILFLGLIPMIWNACGNVSFQAGTANYKSCSAEGADLSNCFNTEPGVLKEQSTSINVQAQTEVDILFVVDNSGSMKEEQVGIGNKISGFLDRIKNLNWQIAVTTTDGAPETKQTADIKRPWGDGQFRPFDSDTGSQFILRSTQTNVADAQSFLSNAIQVGLLGSGNERGINASYRAVARSQDPGPHRDFFRANAKLAVVVISDEDECSTGAKECPAATAEQSVPQKMIDHVRATLGANKGFSFHSIVGIPGDASCTSAGNKGNVYKEMSELTNGVLASVCATDYATPLKAIGDSVVQLVKSATLSCAPADLNADGKGDVQIVLANGSVMTSGFNVAGNQVVFDNALPQGTHRFFWFCKQ